MGILTQQSASSSARARENIYSPETVPTWSPWPLSGGESHHTFPVDIMSSINEERAKDQFAGDVNAHSEAQMNTNIYHDLSSAEHTIFQGLKYNAATESIKCILPPPSLPKSYASGGPSRLALSRCVKAFLLISVLALLLPTAFFLTLRIFAQGKLTFGNSLLANFEELERARGFFHYTLL